MNDIDEKILSSLKDLRQSFQDVRAALEEIVDRMDTRSEKSHDDLYELFTRLRCLEEYLGIEYRNPRKDKKERYLKIKKDS